VSFAPNPLPEFRIKLFGERDGLKIYLVDGMAIRNTIDLDFTDGASHEESEPVPKGEIWLDRDAQGQREYRLTLADVIGTRAALLKGMKLQDAWKAGAKIEGRLRASQFPDQWMKRGPIGIRRLGQMGQVPIWLVDGMKTRTGWDVDFVEGGNSEVYPWLKDALGGPAIAVDNSVYPRERPVIALHEGFEGSVMRTEGTQYAAAHRQANRVELAARHDPAFLRRTLARLGYMGPVEALAA
jgi:hypothetical protein